MNELALFAGAGGGILGGKLLGWTTGAAVEIESYPRSVLFARQRDGILDPFPIWDDITTFDGRPWKGIVDIVSGGFPCQDISAAGKGAGIEGERSGLWGEMARVVREVRPKLVFVENSPMLTSRGLHRVLGDLAEMGYDARWCVLGADDTGGFHSRKRIWILAYTSEKRREQRADEPGTKREKIERCISCFGSNEMADTSQPGLQRIKQQNTCEDERNGEKAYGPTPERYRTPNRGPWSDYDLIRCNDGTQRPVKPGLRLLAHGVANRVDRLKAIGNGQVPAVAALAFTILSEGLI